MVGAGTATACCSRCGRGRPIGRTVRRAVAGDAAAETAGVASGAAGTAASPCELLRSWRWARREQLAPAIARSWARTDSLPRGSDAGFEFRNVGPLVGCPPCLWVYFVASEGGFRGAAPSDEPSGAAHDARRLFERACDAMLSYTVLTSSAGYLPDPLDALGDEGDDADGREPGERFSASHVFARYDLVVALDEHTREQAAALAAAEGVDAADCRLCCLTDFVDVCEEAVQAQQLERLLGPAFSAPAGGARGGDARPLAEIRQATDLPAGGGGGPGLVARALCAAGLERFLITQFPAHLKDRLHPYLVPEGL